MILTKTQFLLRTETSLTKCRLFQDFPGEFHSYGAARLRWIWIKVRLIFHDWFITQKIPQMVFCHRFPSSLFLAFTCKSFSNTPELSWRLSVAYIGTCAYFTENKVILNSNIYLAPFHIHLFHPFNNAAHQSRTLDRLYNYLPAELFKFK